MIKIFNMIKILIKLWKGQYTLSKSYWFFGNIVPLIFFIFLISLALFFQENSLEALLNLKLVPEKLYQKISLIFLCIIFLIYTVISTVGIWRSSNFYQGKKYWSTIAKIAIIFTVITYVKDIFKFFT